MKKPTIEEVREHFKDAEIVKCSSDKSEYKIDLSRKIEESEEGFYLDASKDGDNDSCCLWFSTRGFSEIITFKTKIRYWFVVFNYATEAGFGNGNLGLGSEKFNREEILKLAYEQSPKAISGSVVITNFIEMSEEDYNEFWKK